MAVPSTAPVLWVTGLSGAGKSTLARLIFSQLRQANIPTVILDGDEFREVIDQGLGHSPEERLKNAYRLSKMSRLLSSQGITVVCATMSLFPEIWSWNREHLPGYKQIYLKSDKKTLEERDSKGLYQQARAGLQKNIIGWDLDFEEPEDSDLTLNASESTLETLPQVAEKIVNDFVSKGQS